LSFGPIFEAAALNGRKNCDGARPAVGFERGLDGFIHRPTLAHVEMMEV
jgi:hypothetical protein